MADEKPAPAADEPDKLDGRTREAKAYALAEADALKIEDERRRVLAENELGNYERAHGAPIVKGE